MPNQCEQLRADFAEVKKLQASFALELEEAIRSGDLVALGRIRDELEEKLGGLEKQVESFRWEQFDRRTMISVVRKEKYKAVETLAGHAGGVSTLQVLADGRIVSGHDSGEIIIWSKPEAGELISPGYTEPVAKND